eukprot:1567944-Pleurochrysis_carterae.AAC.2
MRHEGKLKQPPALSVVHDPSISYLRGGEIARGNVTLNLLRAGMRLRRERSSIESCCYDGSTCVQTFSLKKQEDDERRPKRVIRDCCILRLPRLEMTW